MLIIFTGISTNTINLINNNSQFEYILFDQKEDTIFENEENFIVIYEEDYLEINNLLKLKKSKKQVYFIGIFKEGNIDLIKKLVNLDVLDYIFDTSKDSISSLINKIKSLGYKEAYAGIVKNENNDDKGALDSKTTAEEKDVNMPKKRGLRKKPDLFFKEAPEPMG